MKFPRQEKIITDLQDITESEGYSGAVVPGAATL